jgi:hypothetical protein
MTTKMNVSRKVFSDVEVMNWLKNQKGFKDNTFPQEWVDKMHCSTYNEWCDVWIDCSGLERKDYIVPYIDFKRLLIDEYNNDKEHEQVLFCIGNNGFGNLRTFQNPDEDDEIEYVCSMPFHKQTCRDCEEEECAEGWWKDGEFLCEYCWEEDEKEHCEECDGEPIGTYGEKNVPLCLECRDEKGYDCSGEKVDV